MDFSECYRYSGPSPSLSPDGKHVATVVDYRLVIRNVETLRVVQLYSCLDRIHRIEWSPNCLYVLCALNNRAVVQVWSVDEPEWTCKIDEGPAGVQYARWSPDGRCILVAADFSIRLTVWSLVDRTCVYMKGPKYADRGLCFSPDGDTMAMVERSDCKDFLSIYKCGSWQLIRQFQTDTTDLTDISWSPDGNCIAVWDTALTYKLLVYSPEGRCLASYSAYSDGLGVRNVRWSPAGEVIAVGSYDQVYKEVEEVRNTAVDGGVVKDIRARYIVCELPIPVPASKPPLDKPNPKLGVSQQSWSPDGQYLATLNDNMPSTVWVWDMRRMELGAVMLHNQPVKSIQWAPTGTTLALAIGSSRIYLWSPAGASIVHIPLRNFQAHTLEWAATGSCFIISDKEAFACAYISA